MLVRTMRPSNAQRAGLEAFQKKNKHHIFAPIAGVRCSISPKLCTMIENVEQIKNLPIVFRSNAQFFLHGARKKSG